MLKVLIIGFGSIGKRHYEVLSSLKCVDAVDVVSRQVDAPSVVSSKLDKVEDLDLYDYFIISSQTSQHFTQLKSICERVEGKVVLVEKPLFDSVQKEITCSNTVFTAYNLRFHPVIRELKRIIESEEVYFAHAICGQYLPTWRPGQDYRQSYSADINQGGGVLRDLSHELDYFFWMFGGVDYLHAIDTKVSDLDINSDDLFTAVGRTDNGVIINISVDYISKNPIRRIMVHTKENTIDADVINNSIRIFDKNGKQKNIEFEKIDRNYTYLEMHKSILLDELETACSFKEGLRIVEVIDSVDFRVFE